MLDALTIMMTEAGKLPLLNPEQERALAGRVIAGNPAARERLILHNMRLVVSIAQKWGHSSLSREDIIQTGYIGLVKAVDGFDPSMGTKFSTYATPKIIHEIRRAVQQADMIAVPAHFHDGRYDKIDAPDVLRFEAPAQGDTNNDTLGDFIAAPEQGESLDFDGMLSMLSAQEASILRARYEQDETLQEVGDRMGVTRERVRQLERAALDKLKAVAA